MSDTENTKHEEDDPMTSRADEPVDEDAEMGNKEASAALDDMVRLLSAEVCECSFPGS